MASRHMISNVLRAHKCVCACACMHCVSARVFGVKGVCVRVRACACIGARAGVCIHVFHNLHTPITNL